MANADKPQGNIRFLSHDLPALKDGLYQLDVKHTFQSTASDPQASITPVTKHFALLGPRFSLEPQEISRVFPPDKTTGRYYNVLPHIMFTRSILPWERALNDDATTPWLTLLLITRQEIDTWNQQTKNQTLLTVQTDTLQNVFKSAQSNSNLVFPKSLVLEPGESCQDRISYIDIPEPLLSSILPTQADLKLLVHVRQSSDPTANGTSNPKYPILICNRLPQPGDENMVFLVSLENRIDIYTHLNNYNPATYQANPYADPLVYRLIILTNWRFASVDASQTFTELLVDADANEFQATGSVLRLTHTGNPNVDQFYDKGYVPLQHQTRQGNQMVSWYRSPLLPGAAAAAMTNTPIQSSDQLVRFFSTYGMFDVTYAAAWELGRLLMLRNKRVSVALFNWKRANAQASKSTSTRHLPLGKPTASLTIPDVVAQWFKELGLLAYVPFNYLVPDERLLPKESIRFFTVDQVWVKLLMLGAFSIGRATSSDHQLESKLFQQIPTQPAVMSGFLLRSQVVAGWPLIEIEGYDWCPSEAIHSDLPFAINAPDDKKLECHKTQLAPGMLLCLFEGNLQMVEMHEPPETIHFGVVYQEVDSNQGIMAPCYYKVLRDQNGDPYSVPPATPCSTDKNKDVTSEWVRVPFKDDTSRTIDISMLADRLKQALNCTNPLLSSKFALEMIEGVPKVRFLVGTA